MRIAYIGSVLPNSPNYYEFTRSNIAGNLANLGIVEGLQKSGLDLDLIVSYRPVGYYPHSRYVFKCSERVLLFGNVFAYFAPLVNIFPLRGIVRTIYLYWKLLIWSFSHMSDDKCIIVYNLFSHGLGLRLVSRILRCKLVPIIFDWLPVSGEKPDLIHRLIDPIWLRKKSLGVLEDCDGCFVISENVVKDFAPNTPFRLIDGGVGQTVIRDLFPIECRDDGSQFRIMFAGGLRDINHIDILLEYMKKHADPGLRLILAGKGDAREIMEAARKDDRIVFKGLLNQYDLFEEYGQADVLVSLRDLNEPNLKYHFPSKTLEMLAIGKPFITTNSSHTKAVYGEYCKVLDVCTLEAFEKAVGEVRNMTSQERCAYGRRAREFILREHTWEAQGRRMREFIEGLYA